MAAPRKYPDELRERATRMAVEAIKGADCPGGTIPQPGFDGLRVCVPNRQRILVKQSREFGRVEDIRSHRIYLEEVAAAPEKFVFHVPSSTAHELIRGGALTNAGSAVWSLAKRWGSVPRRPWPGSASKARTTRRRSSR